MDFSSYDQYLETYVTDFSFSPLKYPLKNMISTLARGFTVVLGNFSFLGNANNHCKQHVSCVIADIVSHVSKQINY